MEPRLKPIQPLLHGLTYHRPLCWQLLFRREYFCLQRSAMTSCMSRGDNRRHIQAFTFTISPATDAIFAGQRQRFWQLTFSLINALCGCENCHTGPSRTAIRFSYRLAFRRLKYLVAVVSHCAFIESLSTSCRKIGTGLKRHTDVVQTYRVCERAYNVISYFYKLQPFNFEVRYVIDTFNCVLLMSTRHNRTIHVRCASQSSNLPATRGSALSTVTYTVMSGDRTFYSQM